MWALIENGTVARVVNGDTGLTIGEVQHSAQIFGPAWSDKERAAIGLLPVRYDEPENPDFWEEDGVKYEVSKTAVKATRGYKPRDLDDVKDRLSNQIKGEARRLINAVMKDFQQRNSVAELALMLIANGTDLKAWPDDDRKALDSSKADWSYVKAIRAESERRESEIAEHGDVKSLEAYDWKTGWPLPS